MRIFTAEGYVTIDFANRRMSVIRRDAGQKLPFIDGFGHQEISWQDHDALEAEHAAFIAAITDGAPVLVDAAAGRRALAAALAVTAEMEAARQRMRASGLIA